MRRTPAKIIYGQAARNTFERDVYDHIEASIAVDHPARQSARNDPEAGQ